MGFALAKRRSFAERKATLGSAMKSLEHIDDKIDESLRHPAVSPRQVAPQPEVELEDQFDRGAMVRQVIEQHPDATADEIVGMLAQRQVEVSSALVQQELQRHDRHSR